MFPLPFDQVDALAPHKSRLRPQCGVLAPPPPPHLVKKQRCHTTAKVLVISLFIVQRFFDPIVWKQHSKLNRFFSDEWRKPCLFTSDIQKLKHNTGKENKARENNLKGQKDGELVIKVKWIKTRVHANKETAAEHTAGSISELGSLARALKNPGRRLPTPLKWGCWNCRFTNRHCPFFSIFFGRWYRWPWHRCWTGGSIRTGAAPEENNGLRSPVCRDAGADGWRRGAPFKKAYTKWQQESSEHQQA